MDKKSKRDITAIANFRDKNEKASWLRKKKNLESLVEKLEPIENNLIALNNKKQEILDEVNEIRKTMLADCIHPQDYLVHYDKYVLCKFCNYKISIPRKI